jgi:hypothetical protein
MNNLVHTMAHWMMDLDDVFTNDPAVHLQSSEFMVVSENSMSGRDSKDQPFSSYAYTGVFCMPCGVLISMWA